jgi:hypothetical protein
MVLTGVDAQLTCEANEEGGEVRNVLLFSALPNNLGPQIVEIGDETCADVSSTDRLEW